nr:hypothetical protein [uncultured Agathobaculum sp.]
MLIPEFDLSVLSEIASDHFGRSFGALEQRFGKESRESVKFLMENGLVKIHERNIKPFMPSGSDYVDPPVGNIIATDLGKVEIKRWNTKCALSQKERWKERVFGFISGVLTTVISGLIISIIAG